MSKKTREERKVYLLNTFGLDGGRDVLLGGVLLGAGGGLGGAASLEGPVCCSLSRSLVYSALEKKRSRSIR